MSIGRAFAVPGWVLPAVYVYFVALTCAVIGGADFSTLAMVVTYLAPVALYAALLVTRAARALGRMEIGLHHEPHALLR